MALLESFLAGFAGGLVATGVAGYYLWRKVKAKLSFDNPMDDMMQDMMGGFDETQE